MMGGCEAPLVVVAGEGVDNGGFCGYPQGFPLVFPKLQQQEWFCLGPGWA